MFFILYAGKNEEKCKGTFCPKLFSIQSIIVFIVSKLSLKLGITSKKFSETNSDWEKSELTPSVATQTLYSGIQAVSFGARLDLGLKDTDAPEIILWNEE